MRGNVFPMLTIALESSVNGNRSTVRMTRKARSGTEETGRVPRNWLLLVSSKTKNWGKSKRWSMKMELTLIYVDCLMRFRTYIKKAQEKLSAATSKSAPGYLISCGLKISMRWEEFRTYLIRRFSLDNWPRTLPILVISGQFRSQILWDKDRVKAIVISRDSFSENRINVSMLACDWFLK